MNGIEGVLGRIEGIISRVVAAPATIGPGSGDFQSVLSAIIEADQSPPKVESAVAEKTDTPATAESPVAGTEQAVVGAPTNQATGVEYREAPGNYFTIGSVLGTSEVRSVSHVVPASDFVFPVLGVSPEGLWNSFGHPWGGHLHAGVDIFAEEGTPIVAATGGFVEIANGAPIGGNRVWIRGDDGRGYYYAHLSAFVEGLTPGMHVDTGEVIGFVGHTGDAINTPDHLHFAISRNNRKPGDSMDPAAAGWYDPGPFLGIGPAPAYQNRGD